MTNQVPVRPVNRDADAEHVIRIGAIRAPLGPRARSDPEW